MMNEEPTAPADSAGQVDAPTPVASDTKANEDVDNSSSQEVKTKKKGGCCSSTKKFLFYDSSRPEIQAFYFNQVRIFIAFAVVVLDVPPSAFLACVVAWYPIIHSVHIK
jgi:hypothetical protein